MADLANQHRGPARLSRAPIFRSHRLDRPLWQELGQTYSSIGCLLSGPRNPPLFRIEGRKYSSKSKTGIPPIGIPPAILCAIMLRLTSLSPCQLSKITCSGSPLFPISTHRPPHNVSSGRVSHPPALSRETFKG